MKRSDIKMVAVALEAAAEAIDPAATDTLFGVEMAALAISTFFGLDDPTFNEVKFMADAGFAS